MVWIHGGAWISGTKEVAAPYFEMLARGGFTVIAVEYSRAPDAQYPTPIVQINDAIAYVQRHADRFHVDDERVIVAGDSAGAQMASQIATLVTNPAYASEVGIVPSLRPEQLRGAILFCGAYDVAGVARHHAWCRTPRCESSPGVCCGPTRVAASATRRRCGRCRRSIM